MRTQLYRLGLAALVAVALLGGAALASADDGTADANGLEWTDAHDWMSDHAGEHGSHHEGAHQHGTHHAGDHDPGVHHGEQHEGQHQHDHEAAGACH
ncbi:hypothetical protein SAMN05444422_105149 [Halobiforma haloterrestris]|uniref:Uncharacterized protein n=1 Tax=Natronobacterium haloterrestre TaxID=148448 RepID=A0A1I1H227_NATHA|nr:hypothetical protein [Halobiforma haloterrestris]SFC17974.1 hypothetical protein SAMN05444422_105149 [Halobiforma haloterrestris]